MMEYTGCFMNMNMNQSERAAAGCFAAAGSSCARHKALTMDAAFCAASIFIILLLAGLCGLAGLCVSILGLVCAVLVRGCLMMRLTPRLEQANPVF